MSASSGIERVTGHRLRAALAEIVGDDHVMAGPEELTPYAKDYSPFPAISPGIVVRPGSAEEISKVLELANRERNVVVPRGGGASITGYSEAAPHEAILLETRRLDRVLEIDEVNMTVTAETGILMTDLERAVVDRGLYVHTVAAPAVVASLGGVVSGVIGGGQPLDGATVGTNFERILGLKVVLPTGRLLSTGAGGSSVYLESNFLRGCNGPDLTGMFIGDGGSFGVKVEVTLRLHRQPRLGTIGSFEFDGFEQAWQAYERLTDEAIMPRRLWVQETDEELVFWLLDGDRPDLSAELEAICREAGGRDPSPELQEYAQGYATGTLFRAPERVSTTRAAFSFLSGKKEFPDIWRALNDFVSTRIDEINARPGRDVSAQVFFRPSTPHTVHGSFSIVHDRERPDEEADVRALIEEGYGLMVKLGGSPHPQQGFGSKAIGAAWSAEFRDLIRGFKLLVDPNNILSPDIWGLDG